MGLDGGYECSLIEANSSIQHTPMVAVVGVVGAD